MEIYTTRKAKRMSISLVRTSWERWNKGEREREDRATRGDEKRTKRE